MAASISSSTLFGQSIERVLNSWTVLKLAVEHGFGGIDSREKAEWMVFAIETWFKENTGIEVYELEEFLADVLNEEFDTVADDGSLPQISSMICSFYRLYKEGKEEEVKEKMSRLPNSNLQNCLRGSDEQKAHEGLDDEAAASTSQSSIPSTSTSHTTPQLEQTVSQENQPQSNQDELVHSNQTTDDMDVDEEGWQVVHRGRRK